jgi:hypothetical protein
VKGAPSIGTDGELRVGEEEGVFAHCPFGYQLSPARANGGLRAAEALERGGSRWRCSYCCSS